MFDKLASEEQRYEDLMRLLGTSEVQSDSSEYRKHAKALAEVEPLVEKFRDYKAVAQRHAQTCRVGTIDITVKPLPGFRHFMSAAGRAA